ncbi:transglutaminase-like domain-containing protein [Pseudonocardia abyssalis]|uniref:Transglutaminase family protein n=1 Tax=Pseudonocardia abyssalis TaxID=2792008 RepID=A0ABS6UZC9_9PSEU|nr:transglutaminase-like domain-containing protein [Pseudonocardia abyssalis]MBW0118268.1 transglutaminase family protein [Pseudonocardia abyssalis]MBW0137336.1 transglutaminase family protein [Pseudonocardia abyssalis]
MDPVQRFGRVVGAPDPPLDRAALALAAGAQPDLDITRWLRELDRLAAGVSTVDGLCQRLFVDEGFGGNVGDYTDPRNSLLHHVLGRRLGIPITLAVVTMEVGRRAGLPMEGVGMPGHFLVRPTGTSRYLDVFAGGVEISGARCEELFRGATGAGPEIPFGPHLLTPTPTRAILARMLENLRAVYGARRRPGDLEWVLRMRLLLPGVRLADVLELGEALGDQGRWLEGAKLLEDRVPAASAAHAERLRTAAKSLKAHLN